MVTQQEYNNALDVIEKYSKRDRYTELRNKLLRLIEINNEIIDGMPSEISKLRQRVQHMDSHKIHRHEEKRAFIVHYIDEEAPFEYDVSFIECMGERVDESRARRMLKGGMISLIELYEKSYADAPKRIQELTNRLRSL